MLRFDYRGMGDAHGDFVGFEHVDDDIRAAIDTFKRECPEVEEVVLWGECDASSAILFYAYRDARVKGAVLLNPWVRTEAGEARAARKHLRHELRWKPEQLDVMGYWRRDSADWDRRFARVGADLYSAYTAALADGMSGKDAFEAYDDALEQAGL